jgi:hypothetical protein
MAHRCAATTAATTGRTAGWWQTYKLAMIKVHFVMLDSEDTKFIPLIMTDLWASVSRNFNRPNYAEPVLSWTPTSCLL